MTAKEKKKAYYLANKERISTKGRIDRLANPEKVKANKKAYYLRHSDEIKTKIRAYQQAHPDKKQISNRAHYLANREKIKARQKAYRHANSEKFAIKDRKRRAIKRGVKHEAYATNYVFERDGWICQVCGQKINKRLKYPNPRSGSIDHIVPLSKGGNDAPSNVQATHLRCNLGKHATNKGQLRLFG